MRTVALTNVAFPQAAVAWLETRKPYLSEETLRNYAVYVKTLSAFFAEMRLPEITADQIRAYQRARMATVESDSINKETSVLQQMLKRIGAWPAIAPDFQPLPKAKNKDDIGRCISDDEESRFFRAALSNPNYCVAAWASLLSVNTTAGPGEILHLHLEDVDIENKRTIRIAPEGAKNRGGRVRILPLNDPALWAVKMFMARAKDECKAWAPNHYLIPFVLGPRHFNVLKPQTHYYRAFKEILALAELKFRPYDFRHTAITRLLENPDVPLEVARSIAGHISDRMIRRYFHGRLSAQRSAVVAALARRPPEAVRRMLQAESKQ